MTTETLAKTYEPREVENRWYGFWEENGFFRADENSSAEHFSIVIPPPNVTGNLHMGHALNNTLQDMLIRYHRMKGHNTLWVPGMDHAGIATQNVVERHLAAENISRRDLGRDKFVDRVWEWKEQYGGQIINQLKRLASSCDWDRERFTMDEGLSRAVVEVFVRLHEEGLIYRGDYIINWCPRCRTALADLEVEHEELAGNLYYVHYSLADGEGHLTVATTRPETMLGDTAVAVNPEDPRYKKYIGRDVLLPILKRRIPVIGDPYVDVEFGTGALKITPAHDPNDFEIGSRHNLPAIKCIDDDGRMNEEAGPYSGQDRFECRKNIIADLKAEGLLEKIEEYRHSVGHCYRCKTIVEPNLSKQWFIRIKPLADKAITAVEEGRTRIIPRTWEKTYFEWMRNIKDWCISRQLWWGHRIPAYYCLGCNEVIVARERPGRCPFCQSAEIEQETDVLDTWFSSALWPFSTLGWPDRTKELETYYPTSVLITGFDILFFWVARMMMMGLHFMDEVPFKNVYIHALVRDADGLKMSKSKGNVVDPLEVMDRFGTDAFRFTLAALAAQGRDVRLSDDRIQGYRNFVNKLWNASRFTLMNLDGYDLADTDKPITDESGLSLADAWILSRIGTIVGQVETHLNEYHFDRAAGDLYQFVWHEFCDWYLELIKPVLYGDDQDARRRTQAVLAHVLSVILRLLHPIMPFVTEEIWQKLPGAGGWIITARFPSPDSGRPDPKAEQGMELLQGVITAVRNIRGEMNVPPSQQVEIIMMAEDAGQRRSIEEQSRYVLTLARGKSLQVKPPEKKPKGAAAAVFGQVEVFINLKGLIDFDEEARRLQKEMDKLDKEIIRSNKKLSNEDFLSKAPAEIVAREKDKVKTIDAKREKLALNLARVEELKGQ
ncbi:MAG: valine--tRNA ligase [Thermodesulfobacteriota bacterium]|nr:valine--tRNA ligase [Thermodesulfobacteriota bacterium]